MSRILIIGATSAIASEMARRLSADGHALFLIGRDQHKLDALIDTLSVRAQGVACADFCASETVPQLVDAAITHLGGLDIALIAHGYIGDQIVSESDFCHAEKIIQTNFLSAVAFLIPISQYLEQHGSGKIAVMTSVAGDRGRPRNYTYGSAKGALHLYLQGLRSKLWHSGVEVYSFKLGPVITPMTVDHNKNFSFSSIDKVAGIMLRTLQTRRYTRYVPGYWFWVMWVVRNVPEVLFQRIGFLSGR